MRPVETSFPATPDRVDAVSEIRGGCYRYLVHTSSNTTRHNVELTEAATCSSQSGGVAEGPTCEDAPRLQVHGSTAGGGESVQEASRPIYPDWNVPAESRTGSK